MIEPAQPNPFRRRQRDAALSLWGLGDLLGIHPHQLPAGVGTVTLAYLPVSVIIELARQLDVHPADLIPELETVLDKHRVPGHASAPIEPTAEDDALSLLTALATATGALCTDDIAAALRWTLDRVHKAIGHVDAHPQLAGPLALRRTAPHRAATPPPPASTYYATTSAPPCSTPATTTSPSPSSRPTRCSPHSCSAASHRTGAPAPITSSATTTGA